LEASALDSLLAACPAWKRREKRLSKIFNDVKHRAVSATVELVVK